LSPGAGDLEYVAIFHKLVAPVLKIFKPELILVSAGFDAHERDPLGGMGITAEGYEQMVQILMCTAAKVCSGRLVLTLEGGYDLHALRESIASVLLCLSTFEPDRSKETAESSMGSLHPRAARILTEVLSTQREYWPDLPSK
jgi:acetoin utilization deacetylase AcuC-like enzyme